MNNRVNLLLPEMRANPYPIYEKMRRESPVCQVDPAGMWAVSRYADAQFVLKNHDLFSSAGFEAALKPAWLPDNPLGDSLLVRDPPKHFKQRNLLTRAFNPQSVARLELRVRAIANELIDHLQSAGEADFVAEFATPLPGRIIGELIGMDPSLHRNVKRWSEDLATITPVAPSDERVASIRGTVTEMRRQFQELVDARRKKPCNDLVSDLIGAEIDGEVLSDAEILAFLFLLLQAGFETTACLFTNSLLVLLDRPELLLLLRSDPTQVPAFIEEVLRYESPGHGYLRITTAEVELGGVTLPRGAVVIVLAASANRDEAQYPDPDRFDIRRGAPGGLAFGFGVHFCIGAALARLEGRVGLEALFARFQGFSRMPGPIDWGTGIVLRSLLALPLAFRSA